jgi:large subunit ribosomal protein L10e
MKASNFNKKRNMAYTQKKYMRGIPGSKIVKYTMGNPGKEFPFRLELVGLKSGQIRHNALESARIAANRVMEGGVGRENFMLKIVPFPHQVLREHKRVNVAQADRFQEGMKRAYGKPVGTAARVKRGAVLIVAEVEKQDIDSARTALKRASDKFPIPCRIRINEN